MTDETRHSNPLLQSLKSLFGRKSCETVRETIEDLIEESDGNDNFSEHEQLLLSNILDLKDTKCGHAMVPRADIIAFHQDGTVGELAELMLAKGHSRIPVYGDSLDDILGVVHVIDLLKPLLEGKQDTKVHTLLCREVKFVSPSMRVLDLLHEMQLNKIHMAIVVDEYGGVDGLITIEDLLEEIVGDIEDEYDFEEEPVILLQEEGVILADARAELDEIHEVAGIDLYEGLEEDELEVDTLGGLVFHLAQRIPNRGEIIEGRNGIKFRILDLDPRRIKKVMISLPCDKKCPLETPETDTEPKDKNADK